MHVAIKSSKMSCFEYLNDMVAAFFRIPAFLLLKL
jgi:hypothetical protein